MNYELVTIAAKFLRPVEINAFQSNQHEFHGVSAFKHVFGTNHLETKPLTYYIDYEYDVTKSVSDVTWYDAREADPYRSEYRLYYKNNSIFYKLKVDDLMLLAKSRSGKFVIIFIENNSEFYKSLLKNLDFTSRGEHYILLSTNDLDFLSKLWGLCDNNKNLVSYYK